MREFFEKLIIVICFVIVIGTMIIAVRYIDIFIDNVPIVVTVDNKIVFEGKSYLCMVESTGDTTKVTIHNGFLGLLPKAYYVSDNVKVEGMK